MKLIPMLGKLGQERSEDALKGLQNNYRYCDTVMSVRHHTPHYASLFSSMWYPVFSSYGSLHSKIMMTVWGWMWQRQLDRLNKWPYSLRFTEYTIRVMTVLLKYNDLVMWMSESPLCYSYRGELLLCVCILYLAGGVAIHLARNIVD